jgi:hypothetical protein
MGATSEQSLKIAAMIWASGVMQLWVTSGSRGAFPILPLFPRQQTSLSPGWHVSLVPLADLNASCY